MKKSNQKLFAVILVLAAVLCLVGCRQQTDDRSLSVFELTVSDEIKEKAEAAYIGWYENAYGKKPDVQWVWDDPTTGVVQRFSDHCRYYGTFDGCVVWFSGENWEKPSCFELGGYSFDYGTSTDLHVYKDGEYYPLASAVNKELISAEDLAIIAERHWSYGKGYRNYGTFRCCQVWLADSQKGDAGQYELAESVFDIKTGAVIYVRKDGANSTLQQAYEKGWLTKEDVAQIGKLHNERELTYFELVISDELKTNIQKAYNEWEKGTSWYQDYFQQNGVKYPLTKLEWDQDRGTSYFGTFGDCAAWATFGDAEVLTNFTLAGSRFEHPTAAAFHIYRNGKHYTLQEAYDQKLICAEDIAIIAERHAERCAPLENKAT